MNQSGILFFIMLQIFTVNLKGGTTCFQASKNKPDIALPDDFNSGKVTKKADVHSAFSRLLYRTDHSGILQKPEVTIVQPEKDWQKTNQMEMTIEAKIKYVYSELDLVCTVNGKTVEFDFFYDRVSFVADLQKGPNVIKIVANNEEGSVNDIKRIIFDPDFLVSKEDLPSGLLIGAPIVELISPEKQITKSDTDIFSIQAYVENVEKKEDIKLTANDMELTGFRFDPILGSLSIRVRLAEGDNEFVLLAKNDKGRTEKTFTIKFGDIPEEDPLQEEVVTAPQEDIRETENVEYEEVVITDDDAAPGTENVEVKAPVIRIMHPVGNPYYAKQEKVLIQASITGIKNSGDIDFVIDGKRNIFFDYNEVSSILRYELQLIGEETEVKISARNETGLTSNTLMVHFGDDPVVTDQSSREMIVFESISEPEMYCLTHFEVKINVTADKEDIELELNGSQVGNFMYSKAESKMRFSLYLRNGQNEISVSINNKTGKYKADTVIACFDYESEYVEKEVITEPAFIEYITPETGHTTKEASVILQIKLGNIQTAEEIKVLLNDKTVEKIEFDSINSLAQVMLTLAPKQNLIYVGAYNEFGGEETENTIYYDKQYTQTPAITINAPRNGFTTDKNFLMFKADVSYVNELSEVQVFLNKKKLKDFDYNNDLGRIQSMVDLNLGKNTIEVRAENNMGESVETITFNYRVRSVPAVQIIQPREGLEYKDKTVSLLAVVQNITSRSGITLTVNGKVQPSLNFDKTKDEVTGRITLNEGENIIVLTAKNDNGSATSTVRLNVRGALKKPVIRMVNPSKSEITVSSDVLNLEAEVDEIIHSTQVDISVNGKIIEEVFYIKENKMIKADIPLTKGKNTIRIVASNDSGLDNATLVVNYK